MQRHIIGPIVFWHPAAKQTARKMQNAINSVTSWHNNNFNPVHTTRQGPTILTRIPFLALALIMG